LLIHAGYLPTNCTFCVHYTLSGIKLINAEYITMQQK